MTFGFGTFICPVCYSGEEVFIFFDHRYWLNKIMIRNSKYKKLYSREVNENSRIDNIIDINKIQAWRNLNPRVVNRAKKLLNEMDIRDRKINMELKKYILK